MEEFETIKKEDKHLAREPNLKDYDETYRTFSWEDARKEVAFFEDGSLNAAYNAVDKYRGTDKWEKTALIWLDSDRTEKRYTFRQLSEESNRFANLLLKLGIKKGDRVFIFMPRIPQLYFAFLGILKTGAIAGTLFQAFGPAALKDRLGNSEAVAVVTHESLKERIYEVKGELPELKHIIVVGEAKEGEVPFSSAEGMSPEFSIAHTKEEDYAFMLYTSGTTGKPKGVLHAHAACIQEHITAKWVLDLKEDDIYWCTADPGWVTGIAYTILGNWSNGVTTLIYNGRFSPDSWYKIIEDYKVSVWYTAPTAIRMLMKEGDEIPKKYDLSSLRYMCSVGEPLNPEAVVWGMKVFNKPFHDGWWQTETGAIMIANYPAMDVKPGSMGKPIPGVVAGVVDDNGNQLKTGEEGNLAIKRGWPSMMRAVWKNEDKYKSYFIGDWYISGDKASVDEDGYFWFVGRADDVIKTAGERVGPFEVESALIDHPAVAEAAVIGKPDELRGEIIKAFITLNKGYEKSDELKKEIQQFVKKHMAGHAYPREIDFMDSLPKTRSGKIMRRLLKAKELGLPIGDTSTLEND